MLDYNMLFYLILIALILIVIALFGIVGAMIVGDRQKKKGKITGHECVNFFGYLANHPRTQTIPDECFGCTLAIDCIKAEKKEGKKATRMKLEAKAKVEDKTVDQYVPA